VGFVEIEQGGPMAEMITTGVWMVDGAKEAAFVEAWSAFARWASSMPGAGTLRLGHDLGESGRFVSYGAWEHADAVHSWKTTPEFRERMAQVMQYVDAFHPTELDVVATGTGGSAVMTMAPQGAHQ
jgi:heme-degrading monooxygenase HmoA